MTTEKIRVSVDGAAILCPRGEARRARAIYRAADDGGTIPAGKLVRWFPGEPERHGCALLSTALGWIDAEVCEL
jgi:hypothetical protein